MKKYMVIHRRTNGEDTEYKVAGEFEKVSDAVEEFAKGWDNILVEIIEEDICNV